MSPQDNIFNKYKSETNFFKQVVKDANKTYLLRNADTFEEHKVSHKELKGERGDNGRDGKDGKHGKDGTDGRAVIRSEIDKKGFLSFIYSDGIKEKVAQIMGRNGKDGRDGVDGKDGENGRDGADGLDGQDGRGIVDAFINPKGELVIIFSDGEEKNLGRIVGRDGQSIQTNIGGKVIDTAGLGLTGQMFRSIAVAGQNTINAQNYRDILTFISGGSLSLTTNAKTKALTFSSIKQGNFFIATPANNTGIPVISYAEYAFTINGINNLKTSSGSITLSVQINGTNVTGLANLSVTSTPQSPSATALNKVNIGDRITIVLASNSSSANLEFTMKGTA